MTHHVEITRLSAQELVELFRRKALSPVDAARAALDQVERLEPTLNAWCLVDADRALADARASEERYRSGTPAGPIDGVPTGIKDIFLTKGWPTLRGSALTDEKGPWEDDAPVVAALRRNGAVMLGKTTTPELGWKGVTDSPRHGVTRNPWNPDVTPGGSSGGASAAIAAGMVPLAPGTDGAGSIRIPAAFAGISGIKPTYGRVPAWPPSPYGTMAHAGPMARTVADVALLLNVLSEPDARDWSASAPDHTDYVAALAGGVRGLRVAVSSDLGYYRHLDPEVRATFEAAAGVFEELGAHVDQEDPGFEDPLEIYRVLWDAGAAYATRQYSDEQREKMDPGLREMTAVAARYSALDYLDASARRGNLGVHMGLFHERYDLLLTPTMPIPAFRAGQDVPDGWPHRRWDTWSPYTYPFNLTQQPAASVPCGFTNSGLPIGLHIVAARHQDALVLRAANAFQEATDHLRWPPMADDGGAA